MPSKNALHCAVFGGSILVKVKVRRAENAPNSEKHVILMLHRFWALCGRCGTAMANPMAGSLRSWADLQTYRALTHLHGI